LVEEEKKKIRYARQQAISNKRSFLLLSSSPIPTVGYFFFVLPIHPISIFFYFRLFARKTGSVAKSKLLFAAGAKKKFAVSVVPPLRV
jgi:hypothetical protein